jgi:phage/plasmid-like protein (TIGR03299 family)
MSAETSNWLNTMTLQGFTDKRGTAWHYLASEQGAESNHYAGAIPVEDIKRRLFNWTPFSAPITVTVPDTITDDGVTEGFTVTDPERQAIGHPVTRDIFGIFKSGYVVHGFNEWCVGKVENLLGSGLAPGSAGLLKKGAVGWVQMELPETISHGASGVDFRPNLTATTSLDGSLSTTYVRGNRLVVCDNTLSAALLDSTALTVKIKHTRYSAAKVNSMAAALELIETQAEEFGAVLDTLTSAPVSSKELSTFLDLYVPVTDAKGEVLTGRSLTMAHNKRDGLTGLYNHDNRVSPWAGTEFGVLQMANTFEQHAGIIRGQMVRAERNAMQFLTGAVDKMDANVLTTLAKAKELANA